MVYIRGRQWQEYAQEHLPPQSYMHGTLIVKDLSNNVHRQRFTDIAYRHRGDDPAHHVEENLINGIIAECNHHNIRMQSAKVTIAMRDSPCQRCYGKINSWYDRLRPAIVGPNGTLFLLFSFRQFYTSGNHGWPDIGTAFDAYNALALNSERGQKSTKRGDLDHKILSTISFVYDSAFTGQSYLIGFRLEE